MERFKGCIGNLRLYGTLKEGCVLCITVFKWGLQTKPPLHHHIRLRSIDHSSSVGLGSDRIQGSQRTAAMLCDVTPPAGAERPGGVAMARPPIWSARASAGSWDGGAPREGDFFLRFLAAF
jgi:hypothetical protein